LNLEAGPGERDSKLNMIDEHGRLARVGAAEVLLDTYMDGRDHNGPWLDLISTKAPQVVGLPMFHSRDALWEASLWAKVFRS